MDSHELIALCAPHPVFIGAGATRGDAWIDAYGSFLATAGAGPVCRLLGKKDMGTTEFPPIETPLIDGEVASRQCSLGHTDGSNRPTFLIFADRHLKGLPLAAQPSAEGNARQRWSGVRPPENGPTSAGLRCRASPCLPTGTMYMRGALLPVGFPALPWQGLAAQISFGRLLLQTWSGRIVRLGERCELRDCRSWKCEAVVGEVPRGTVDFVDHAADTRSPDFGGSKIMAKNKPFELKPFQPGQIWEVADMSVRIDLIGKTLIHYKRYKGKSRAVPTSFSSRKDLEKYLKDNKAVLVQE